PPEVGSEAAEVREEAPRVGAVAAAEVERPADPHDPVWIAPASVVEPEEAARVLVRQPIRLRAPILDPQLDPTSDDERAVLVHNGGEGREPMRVGYGVVVEERDEVAPGASRAAVSCRGKALAILHVVCERHGSFLGC